MAKKWIIVLILVVIVIAFLDRWNRSNNPYSFESRGAHSERRIDTKAKGHRAVNPKSNSAHPVEQWMSDFDGSIFDFEYKVRQILDEPSSFEHVETSYLEQGLETKVRMKFRAKNKFGAKVLNQADAILNTSDGSVKNITIQ